MAPIPAPVAPPGAVPLGTLADWLLFGVCLFAAVCVIGAIGIHILRQFITPMPGKSDGPTSSRHRHDAVADLGIVTLARGKPNESRSDRRGTRSDRCESPRSAPLDSRRTATSSPDSRCSTCSPPHPRGAGLRGKDTQ